MKVLLDTNIILDYALERQPWFVESEQIFYFAEQKQINAYDFPVNQPKILTPSQLIKKVKDIS